MNDPDVAGARARQAELQAAGVEEIAAGQQALREMFTAWRKQGCTKTLSDISADQHDKQTT